MKCPNCGNEAQDDAVFCDQCGARLRQPEAAAPAAAPSPAPAPAAQPAAPAEPAQAITCPSCGADTTPGELFCGECGAKLAAPQPEPAVAAAAPAAPGPSAPTGATICPGCGAQIVIGDEFCYACGFDLRTSAAQVAAMPAAAPAEAPAVAAPVSQAAEVPTPTASAPAPAPTPAAAAPAAPAPSGPAPAAGNACPACGSQVKPGDSFCDHCGAALTQTAAPAASQPTPAAQPAPAGPGPRLVVVATGAEIPLPAGKEALVGREDPYSGVFPDIDLTPHGGEEGGVSRRHFKVTLSGGQYMIEDLNSTNFTVLNRQRLQPGVPTVLADGDEVRAGRVRLIFRVS